MTMPCVGIRSGESCTKKVVSIGAWEFLHFHQSFVFWECCRGNWGGVIWSGPITVSCGWAVMSFVYTWPSVEWSGATVEKREMKKKRKGWAPPREGEKNSRRMKTSNGLKKRGCGSFQGSRYQGSLSLTPLKFMEWINRESSEGWFQIGSKVPLLAHGGNIYCYFPSGL